MSTDLVVLLVLGVCGIVFVSHYYSKEEKLKRLLRATPLEGEGIAVPRQRACVSLVRKNIR